MRLANPLGAFVTSCLWLQHYSCSLLQAAVVVFCSVSNGPAALSPTSFQCLCVLVWGDWRAGSAIGFSSSQSKYGEQRWWRRVVRLGGGESCINFCPQQLSASHAINVLINNGSVCEMLDWMFE